MKITICSHVLSHFAQNQILSLRATSANFHKASDICIDQPFLSSLKVCFQFDCCDTTKLGTYSNLWHMHGLASVLKQPVQSIYPDINPYIRQFYHKMLIPRGAENVPHEIPYVIMWTRAISLPFDASWTPNHFVPCQI